MKKILVTILALTFVFGLGAQEKFAVPDIPVEKQYENLLYQTTSILTISIKYIEDNELQMKDYATYVGNHFKTTWDKTKGFDGFVTGVLNLSVIFTHPDKVEIIESKDSMVKIKAGLMSEYLKKHPDHYTSHDKYMEFFDVLMGVLGENMGCVYEQVVNDDHTMITVTKK